MKITKFGHACLLVEEGDARLLIDPGAWSSVPELKDLHMVLITHEHQDHLDVARLKELLAHNPDAHVLTHEGVGELLKKEDILYLPIEAGGRVDVKGVSVESVGTDHAIIYGDTPPCRNTGFLIAGKLFVPGDALHDVPKCVEFLALPTGAPWMKLAEAIDYAKAVKPKVAFPVHDAMYTEDIRRGLIAQLFGGKLKEGGIEFHDLADGESLSF